MAQNKRDMLGIRVDHNHMMRENLDLDYRLSHLVFINSLANLDHAQLVKLHMFLDTIGIERRTPERKKMDEDYQKEQDARPKFTLRPL